MRSIGIILAFSLAGCDGSLDDKQQAARTAEVEENQKVENAVQETQEEIDAAREEASARIAEAKKDSVERTNAALQDGRDAVLEAKEHKKWTIEEAQEAISEAGEHARRSIEDDLDDIDQRVKTANEGLQKRASDGSVAAKRSLTEVSERTTAIRAEVKAFEDKTVRSIQEYQAQLNRKISDLLVRLDDAERTD